MTAGCSTPAKLHDAAGSEHVPLSGERDDLVVLVFSSTECPIANAMAPDIKRASDETREAGGRFYIVHARRDLEPEAVRTHARNYELTMPVLVDRDHALVEELDATVTPEAAVLRFTGTNRYEVIYRGSVNNLFGSVGNRRKQATEHYLRDAIASGAAGEPIEVKVREPFGCYIERER